MKNFLMISAVASLLLTSANAGTINKADTQALFGKNNVQTMTLNNNEMISTEGETFVFSILGGIVEVGLFGKEIVSGERGVYIDLGVVAAGVAMPKLSDALSQLPGLEDLPGMFPTFPLFKKF